MGDEPSVLDGFFYVGAIGFFIWMILEVITFLWPVIVLVFKAACIVTFLASLGVIIGCFIDLLSSALDALTAFVSRGKEIRK